jgi:hypothetical protein
MDHPRIVDEIRSLLHSDDQTYKDRMKELAESYAACCDEANRRLRRCEDFLQRGLRSEAVQYAQSEPVLLEVVAALDFPERSQWEQLALLYSLPPAPKLLLETARALNEAFAQEKTLEPLLREHRRLAVGRAPVRDRLAVLRRLVAADGMNHVWTEDVATFETLRFRQIRTDVERALAANRLDELFGCWDELHEQTWTVPPPADLLQTIDQEVRTREHLRKRKAAEDVALRMAQAYRLRDEPEARRLCEEWMQAVKDLQISRSDPFVKHVIPTLKWVAQLDRQNARETAYEHAVRDLEQAFNQGATEDELEELYYAVVEFKRGVPEGLKQRYLERMKTLQRTSAMRERVFLVSTTLIGVVVLVGLVIFLFTRFH